MICHTLCFLPSWFSLADVNVCFHLSLLMMFWLSVPLSALAPGMGVAVYTVLVALPLSVIMALCVGVLAYRRRCRHLHGDITDSSSALTTAFHPGNYKPPRQGEFAHACTLAWVGRYLHSIFFCIIPFFPHSYSCVFLIFIETLSLLIFIIALLFISSHKLILLYHYLLSVSSPFFTALHFLHFKHSSWCPFSCSCHQILISNINPFHWRHFRLSQPCSCHF